MKDQQEAEAKKVMSQDIQTAIMAQTKVIDEKQHDVKADLAQVEPAVIEAQQGQLGPGSAFILINKWINEYLLSTLYACLKNLSTV